MKWVNDSVLDAGLTAARGNKMVVCDGFPIDRADVLARALTDPDAAEAALTADDYALSDGDVSGRKQTLNRIEDLPVVADGTADHVAVIDDDDVLIVSTLTSQAVTTGGTITVNALDQEIADVE